MRQALSIHKTLSYFRQFDYLVSLEELYLFSPIKLSKKQLSKSLEERVRAKKVIKYYSDSLDIYTTGGYSTKNKRSLLSRRKRRKNFSHKKMQKIKFFLQVLSWVPSVQFVGLTGSVAMNNAQKDDDIDLFIISRKGEMFTSRIIGLFLAFIMGLRRKRNATQAPDKVCLNLFFDGRNLTVPKHKRTAYVAHEVLQTKPLINKNYTYERFLYLNRWVRNYFPNVRMKQITHNNKQKDRKNLLSVICYLLEHMCKIVQLFFIRRHITTELISNTQLWFFPDDFESKIKQ